LTEAEWRACPDPERMLAQVRDRVTERARRLFACAACRRVWELLGKGGRKVVRAVELSADADDLGRALAAAVEEAAVARARRWRVGDLDAATFARRAAYNVTSDSEGAARDAATAVAVRETGSMAIDRRLYVNVGPSGIEVNRHRHGVYRPEEREAVRTRTAALQDAWWTERQVQANLLRCLVPWERSGAFDLRWRTADVLGLARAAAEDKAFERLPLLADALQDAGCDLREALAHCCGGGPHVIGCWVVEWVLGGT
jgi:hypothetical protein